MEPGTLDQVSFLPISASFQLLLLGRVVYLMVAHQVYLKKLLQTCVRHARRLLRTGSESTELAREQMRQQRLQLTQLYLSLLCGMCGCWLGIIQLQLQSDGRFSAAVGWGSLLVFVMTSVYLFKPTLLTTSRLNAVYVVLMACAELALSPILTSPDQLLVVSVCLLGFIRLPAVYIPTHPALVVASSCSTLAMVVLRVLVEGMPGLPVVLAELMGCVLTVVAAVSAQVSMKRITKERLQHSNVAVELRAVQSLLGLACDAVVEVNQDLRLLSHSSELAVLLRETPGTSLAGALFTDFLSSAEEVDRAAELLHRFDEYPPDTVNTQSFHARITDSFSMKFRIQILHVTYHMPDGRSCHLIGICDFPDQKSLLAGTKTPDASGDARSYGMLTPGIFTPNSQVPSMPTIPTRPTEARPQSTAIAHKRLMYLEIDMEDGVVHSSSRPTLAGRAVADLFAEAGLTLLDQVWREAKEKRGSDLRPVSFSALELRASGAGRVDGIIEAHATDLGDLHLMVRCLLNPTAEQLSRGRQTSPRSPTSLARGDSYASLPPVEEAATVHESPSHPSEGPPLTLGLPPPLDFVRVNF